MFRLFSDNETIKEFCMRSLNYLNIDEPLETMSHENLVQICQDLKLVEGSESRKSDVLDDKEYLKNLLRSKYSTSGKDNYFIFLKFIQQFMNAPIFPSEKVW